MLKTGITAGFINDHWWMLRNYQGIKHNKGTNQVCNFLRKSYLVSGVNDIWPHFYYWGIIQTTDTEKIATAELGFVV